MTARRRRAAASWLAALLLLAGAARADEVVLRDGTEVRGEVQPGPLDGPLRIAVQRGGDRIVIEIPREEVRYVRRLGGEDRQLASRAEQALVEGDVDRAVELLGELVLRRPDDARAQRELGFALLLANRDEAAAERLTRACELDPLDFEAQLACGQALQRLDRPDEAIARFREACSLGPSHPVAWRGLAQLLLARGQGRDRAEALKALKRAQEAAPRDEDAAVEHAGAWLEGDRPADRAQARRILSSYVARVPRSLRAGRLLAQLLAAEGQPGRAAALLGPLLERTDLGEPLRETLSAERALYTWLAAGAESLAPEGMDAGDSACDLERAARQLDDLQELLPEDPRLALARARVALRAGDLKAAGALLEALTLQAPRPVARDALLLQRVAAALASEHRPAVIGEGAALPKAQRLALLTPWLAPAHRGLGQALERAGRFEEAAEAYRAGAAAAADEAEATLLRADEARAREQAARKERNGDL